MNWRGVALLPAGTIAAEPDGSVREQPGAAIDRLFAGTRAELLGYFNRRLNNPEVAAEYMQEAFLRFVKSAYDAAGPDARAILFGIARNLLIDHLRQRRRQRECGFQDVGGANPQLLDGVASLEAGPERSLGARQELALVMAAIRELPPKCRQVFVMHRLHGRSHKEIAGELGITRSMVEKHVMEAVARLMKAVR